MSLKFFGIVVAILAVESAVGQDPTMKVLYKKLTEKTNDNPYFKDLSPAISASGETGSMKFTIGKTLPETATITVTAELEGETLVEYEDLICELIKNKIYGEDMLKHGLPADTFPMVCPINAGVYEISKYPLPKEKFPPGSPPGVYHAKMTVGEPNQEPWVIINIDLEISHDLPGVSIPKLGR